jgi:hypothetical protein
MWGVPFIPWLWQHASLNGSGPKAAWSMFFYVCLSLIVVGAVCRLLAGRLSYYIRQSDQEARVERLKRERLGDT